MKRTSANKSKGFILGLLRGGPATIGGLTESSGLSANAVRFHLESLEAESLVAVSGSRRPLGPGKPAAVYAVTAEADLLYSRAYAPVLAACIAELRESIPAKQVLPFLKRVGARLGVLSSAKRRPFANRVRAASEFLNSIGGLTTVVKTRTGYRIVGKGCPLSAVVAEEPCACIAVEAVIAEIVGAKVTEKCDRSGRPSCCFEIAAGGGRRQMAI